MSERMKLVVEAAKSRRREMRWDRYVVQPDGGVMANTLSGRGLTVITPCPVRDEQGQVLAPCVDDDPQQVTDWIRPVPGMVRAAGSVRRETFILEQGDADEMISPYELLYQRVWQDANEDPRSRWAFLLGGRNGGGPEVPSPLTFAVMQGIVHLRGSHRRGYHPPNMVLLAPSAIEALLSLLSLPEARAILFSGEVALAFQWHARPGRLPIEWGWRIRPEDGGVGGHCSVGLVRWRTKLGRMPGLDPNPTRVPWQQVMRHSDATEQLAIMSEIYHPDLLAWAFGDEDQDEDADAGGGDDQAVKGGGR